MAFIDLTKALDLGSWEGLYTVLQRIETPPKMLAVIQVFLDLMKLPVKLDGTIAEHFLIQNEVKQVCVLTSHWCRRHPSAHPAKVPTSTREMTKNCSASQPIKLRY